MNCHDDHHDYELDNFEGAGKQNIQFIKKELIVSKSGDTNGSLKTVHDGTTNEEILRMLIHRMNGLIGKLPDKWSDSARSHMISALADLEMRTNERKRRGVEGTHAA